jgi:Ca2+-binding EF-hand superfamily protein
MLKMNAGEVRNVFERLDADRSDDLDRRELKQLLREIGEPTDPASVDAAMRAIDSSGDGAIQYDEFQAWCVVRGAP